MDKIKKDNENLNQVKQEQLNSNQNQNFNKLKKRLEKITKDYNAIASQNQKKRHFINDLRKDRTLYDHIFKTLEYQILT